MSMVLAALGTAVSCAIAALRRGGAMPTIPASTRDVPEGVPALTPLQLTAVLLTLMALVTLNYLWVVLTGPVKAQGRKVLRWWLMRRYAELEDRLKQRAWQSADRYLTGAKKERIGERLEQLGES